MSSMSLTPPVRMTGAPSRLIWAMTSPASSPAFAIAIAPAAVTGPLTPRSTTGV